MNPIIHLFPNDSTWFSSGWEKPCQRFKIEEIPLRFVFLGLLAILMLWFGVAYFIGLSSNSSWLVFIALIIWLGGIVYYSFPSEELQLIPLALLMIPPALSIIFGEFLQLSPVGIVISSLYFIGVLYFWGKKVYEEIEREPFLVLLSSISLFISFITLFFELFPSSFSNSIFDVYPFFAPIILFWTSVTFLIIRAIAAVLIFISAFAMAITLVKSEGLLFNVNKIVFGRVSEQHDKSILSSFLNSLIKLFNSIIIPSAEAITFTLFIVFVYVVTTVVYFFRSLIFNICYVSIAIGYRFFRFLLLPVGLAGFVMYLIYYSSVGINNYIHFNNINPLQFITCFIIILFILPFVFLYSQKASTIKDDLQLYLTSIILPNVWLYLLLLMVSLALVMLNIYPYNFGALSWTSAILWAFGSLFVITLFFKKQNTA